MKAGDLAKDLRNDERVLIVNERDETAGEIEEFDYDFNGNPQTLAESIGADEGEKVFEVVYVSKLNKYVEGWGEKPVSELEYPDHFVYSFVESDLEFLSERGVGE